MRYYLVSFVECYKDEETEVKQARRIEAKSLLDAVNVITNDYFTSPTHAYWRIKRFIDIRREV